MSSIWLLFHTNVCHPEDGDENLLFFSEKPSVEYLKEHLCKVDINYRPSDIDGAVDRLINKDEEWHQGTRSWYLVEERLL